jgi:hypothetical protein
MLRSDSLLFIAALLLLFSENPRKIPGGEKIRERVTASLRTTMHW